MIYVDDVGIPAEVFNKRTGKIVSSRWYHLITDCLDSTELHAFAVGKLKLHRSYFQEGEDNPGHDHYDLTIGKRKLAIKLGAKPIPALELGRITMAKTAAYRSSLLCAACAHPMGDHEDLLEKFGTAPKHKLLVCQHPTCDCVMGR